MNMNMNVIGVQREGGRGENLKRRCMVNGTRSKEEYGVRGCG